MTDEYFIGIDLGGTNVKIGLLNDDGTIAARVTEPTRVELGPDSLVDRIAEAGRILIKQKNIPNERVKAVGIGSPGPLSFVEGKIIKAGNLPGFDNFLLRSEIAAKMRVPAVLENDANAACWGEFWLGAGKDVMDMIMFTLGTGIGGGIIYNGELMHGSEGNGGELGHIIIQPDGRKCTCGQNGCIEAYASANATANRAAEALQQPGNSTMLNTQRENGLITCKDVFDHAIAGDHLAIEIVEGTAKALAQVCVSMRHITEPQMVVLAGGMIKAGDILTNAIQRHYENLVWTLKPEPIVICSAQLGQDAGLIGAAGLARHAYQKNRLT